MALCVRVCECVLSVLSVLSAYVCLVGVLCVYRAKRNSPLRLQIYDTRDGGGSDGGSDGDR